MIRNAVLAILLLAIPISGQETVIKDRAGNFMKLNADGSLPIASSNSYGGSVAILYDTNTNGKTTVIAGTTGTVIYVRGVSVINDTVSTVNVSLGTGTGTNCATTYTALTPVYTLQAGTAGQPVGFVLPLTQGGAWFKTTAGQNLCVSTSAGVTLHIIGAADQF